MSDQEAMAEQRLTRVQTLKRKWRHRSWPRLYHVPGYGATYRTTMRIMHRFGWHYAPRQYSLDGPERWDHHCQWCGLRGQTLNMDRIGELRPK